MIRTNPDFWDCECEKNYIHPKTQKHCRICRANVDDQPDSREKELPWSVKASDYIDAWDREKAKEAFTAGIEFAEHCEHLGANGNANIAFNEWYYEYKTRNNYE